MCDCTGAFGAGIGLMPKVVEAWTKYVNDSGGINGHPVQVIVKDVALTPARALSSAQELVGTDHVQAIVGNGTVLTGAFADYLASKGVPLIGGNSASPQLLTSKLFFASGTLNVGLLMALMSYFKDTGTTKVGYLYCAEDPACKLSVSQLTAMGKVNGQSLTSAAIATSAPNYLAQCLVMKNAGVTGLFIGDGTPTILHVMADCATIGYKPQLAMVSGTVGNQALNNPVLNGAVQLAANANFYDSSVPAVKQFQDAVDAVDPGIRSSSTWNDNMTYVWAGLQLYKAVAEAGKLTPASTPADDLAAVYKLKGETMDGFAPPLTFSASVPTAFPGCYFLNKFVNGQLVSQDGAKTTCLPASLLAQYEKAVGIPS
jgi:branched-chain amino acid transport system substrate-binding protein